MSYHAVITAGGRVDAEFASALGTPVKALAPFGGTTFLHITIEALRGAGIDRIAVVGGAQVRAACEDCVEKVVEESAGGAENLRRALRAWDSNAPLLYLTSDMPFVTARAIRLFLDAVPAETLALPLTEYADFIARFPGAPPFGVTLGGERVVNGGAFAIPPGAHERIERFATRFFDARKNVWRMARLTGPALLIRFALRRLRVSQLEAHAHRLLGISAAAVRGAPPELAYDVDTLAEYRYAAGHD